MIRIQGKNHKIKKTQIFKDELIFVQTKMLPDRYLFSKYDDN